MNTISQFFRSKIMFSILFCFGPICSMSAEQNQSSQNDFSSNVVVNEIISYLSSHSLFPFLTSGQSEYAHLDFIKDAYNNNTHALGLITQGNASYYTLFSINKQWLSSELQTELVYLSTDRPISPVLFRDVVIGAAPFLPEDASDFHVFIEREEDPNLPNESTLQKWTFFNEKEKRELFVVLTEDGQGGTYFEVKRPNF